MTIHPFDDGNGRVARAVADMALARAENTRQRFYSVSSQIRRERQAYYDILERTQRGALDVTEWLEWFFACFARAIESAHATLRDVIDKARFWEKHAAQPLNGRQVKVLKPVARRFRRRADDEQVGGVVPLLPGHGLPRHPRSRGPRHPQKEPGARTQHQLFPGHQ